MSNITLTMKQEEKPDDNMRLGWRTVYTIKQIKNSTRWNIGQQLSKREVDDAINVLKINVIIQ